MGPWVKIVDQRLGAVRSCRLGASRLAPAQPARDNMASIVFIDDVYTIATVWTTLVSMSDMGLGEEEELKKSDGEDESRHEGQATKTLTCSVLTG